MAEAGGGAGAGAITLAGEEEPEDDVEEELANGERPDDDDLGAEIEAGLDAELGEDCERWAEPARGNGGCGGCWDGAAGVKAEEADGMEALGAAGDGLTDRTVFVAPPKGRAVLL